jgi:hypothetical protein
MLSNRKRIISAVLILGLLLSLVSGIALAESNLTIYTSASDGNFFKTSTNYNTAWTAASSDAVVKTNTVIEIGQTYSAPDYGISRGALYFDTSAIPDADTIVSATLFVYCKYDWSGTDFDLTLQSGMPTYPHDPMVVADYDKGHYADSGGTLNTSGISTTGYSSISLNATGLGWINVTGTTKLVLRSSREIAGTTPTGQEEIFIYSSEETGTSKDPYIVIVSVNAPAITADAASDIANTTARFNSTVSDDGGESCEVRFGYGTTSQTAVNFLSYDTVTSWVAGYDTSEHPYYDADSLTDNTTYYYRVQIKNGHSTVTSDEITFDTLNAISDPSGLRAYPSTTSVVLSWAKGSGSTNTMVRYSFTTYPTAINEGTQLYFSTGSTATHTSLNPGTIIYYSAWGESGGDYSASYDYTMTVTTAGVSDSGTPDAPAEPTGWFQSPDYVNMSGVPLYGTINSVMSTMDLPLATGWFLLAMIVSIAAGLAVLARTGSLAGSLLVLCVLLALGWGVKLIPLWIFAFSLIAGIGIGVSKRGMA